MAMHSIKRAIVGSGGSRSTPIPISPSTVDVTAPIDATCVPRSNSARRSGGRLAQRFLTAALFVNTTTCGAKASTAASVIPGLIPSGVVDASGPKDERITVVTEKASEFTVQIDYLFAPEVTPPAEGEAKK